MKQTREKFSDIAMQDLTLMCLHWVRNNLPVTPVSPWLRR